MGRRTLLLLASILVAAAGTALIWIYVQNADARAQADWRQTVWVLRATAAIDAGATPDVVATLTTKVAVPVKLVPEDAVTDLGQVAGRTSVVPILKDQFILSTQFDTLPSTIGVKERKVAVAVSVDEPNRLAGLLHPNLTVNVYYVDPAKDVAGSTVILLKGVRVLAVGNTSIVRNAKGLPAQLGTQSGIAAGIVTLEVDPLDAKTVIMASVKGVLWFSVPGADVTIPDRDGTTGAKLPVVG